jgi:hypothetical protein
VSTDIGVSAAGRRDPVWYDPSDPRRFVAEIRWLDRPGVALFAPAAVCAVLGAVTLWAVASG